MNSEQVLPHWVVLGCGRQKQTDPAPAIDLYTSPHFRAAARWARSVTVPERVLVFSAKHGLIASDTLVEPYDVSFKVGRGQIPVMTLALQIVESGLAGPVITIAGAEYRKRLANASGGHVEPYNPFLDVLRSEGVHPALGTLTRAMNQWAGRVPSR
jgi:hypothetical protein